MYLFEKNKEIANEKKKKRQKFVVFREIVNEERDTYARHRIGHSTLTSHLHLKRKKRNLNEKFVSIFLCAISDISHFGRNSGI